MQSSFICMLEQLCLKLDLQSDNCSLLKKSVSSTGNDEQNTMTAHSTGRQRLQYNIYHYTTLWNLFAKRPARNKDSSANKQLSTVHRSNQEVNSLRALACSFGEDYLQLFKIHSLHLTVTLGIIFKCMGFPSQLPFLHR